MRTSSRSSRSTRPVSTKRRGRGQFQFLFTYISSRWVSRLLTPELSFPLPPTAVRQDDTERIEIEQADERRREETVKRIKEEEERREKELRRRRREADIDAPEVIFILRELLEPEGGTGLELVGF